MVTLMYSSPKKQRHIFLSYTPFDVVLFNCFTDVSNGVKSINYDLAPGKALMVDFSYLTRKKDVSVVTKGITYHMS